MSARAAADGTACGFGARLSRFTSTNVQILTPEEMLLVALVLGCLALLVQTHEY